MEAASIATGTLDDAMGRIQAGQVEDALSLLRALVQSSPSDGHAHALIGICHAQQGNLDAAVKSLETAALLNPGDAAVEYNLANALFQVGRKDQAAWRLSRIIEDHPEHEDAKLLLSHIQRQNASGLVATDPSASSGQNAAQIAGPHEAPQPRAPQLACQEPGSESFQAPGLGQRLLRGLGWGLLYSQTWTVFSLIGALVLSLFTTRVEHAVVAFLVLGLLTTLFHSAMGVLTGVVVALLNADEDGGGWVGASVGSLILLIGLVAGFLAFWAVVVYLLSGWCIGRAVASRVQRPVVTSSVAHATNAHQGT